MPTFRAEPGNILRQGSTLNHTGSHFYRLEQSRSQQWDSNERNTDVAVPQSIITEHDDPLYSPRTPQLDEQSVNMEYDQHNINRKPPDIQNVANSQGQMLDSTVSGRSKPELQIKVPQKHTARPVLSGPLLYDKSFVYIHSSPVSNSGKISCAFGAIGDQRSPRRGPPSAPLAHGTPKTPRDRVPATAGHCQALPSYDPFIDEDALHHNLELSTMATNDGLSITHNGQTSLHTQGPFTTRRLDYATLHDLVDESTPDFDQYELLVADESGPPKNTVSPYRAAYAEQPGRTRRRRSTSDLRKIPTTSTRNVEETPTTSKSYQGPACTNSSGSQSPSPMGEVSNSGSIVAPVWRRSGPSFASSIRPSGTLSQSAPIESRMSRFAPERATSAGSGALQDSLDPEEFRLPYGSIVYSMKSNNITNLQVSLARGAWTSTSGSNLVLTEAWERKKPEEKIILLFSITHSIKHSGKYLGMAEVVGPLDVEADCELWPEKKNGSQGQIPVRWIVAKDVPFSKFQDLRYHEQHVTQVRHGNTIPGKVGRLVVERYFEATHGPTAILHPLCQNIHDTGKSRTQSSAPPSTGSSKRWHSLPHRHEFLKGETYQRGRGGQRSNARSGLWNRSMARWTQNGSPTVIDTFTATGKLNPNGLPHPMPGSFRRIIRPVNVPPPYSQPMRLGSFGSTFGGPPCSGGGY